MEDVTQRNKLRDSLQVLKTQAEELYLRGFVPELDKIISPLDFYRDWVAPNVPVVFRGVAQDVPAIQKWTRKYLREKLGEKTVTVAVTPNGYADAISDDRKYFMLPEERQMKFSDFIDAIDKQESCDDDSNPIFYMQQQNSNLLGEMKDLIEDVPSHIDWATQAFGQSPDAANFWMGDARAVTSTHKDPYENLYIVIHGEKTFVLNPPTDLPVMPYRSLPTAQFAQVHSKHDYKVVTEENSTLRWICPSTREGLPAESTSVTVKVRAGDILYLPSLWFHHVSQSHGCIAVNYWYDMKYDIKYAYFCMLERMCEDA